MTFTDGIIRDSFVVHPERPVPHGEFFVIHTEADIARVIAYLKVTRFNIAGWASDKFQNPLGKVVLKENGIKTRVATICVRNHALKDTIILAIQALRGQ